jgi:hypothetical protein
VEEAVAKIKVIVPIEIFYQLAMNWQLLESWSWGVHVWVITIGGTVEPV